MVFGLMERHKILKKGGGYMEITLEAARVNVGLDRKTAASKLGVSPDTLANWENGNTFPNVPHIMKIEDLYSVRYADIKFLLNNSV